MSVGEYEVSLRSRYLDAKRRLVNRGVAALPVPVVVADKPKSAPSIAKPKRARRRSLVENVLRQKFPMASMQSVIMKVSRAHDVAPLLVAGESRSREVVAARNEVFSILNRNGISLERIGRAFGKDHTTVLYGIRRHHGEQPNEIKPKRT